MCRIRWKIEIAYADQCFGGQGITPAVIAVPRPDQVAVLMNIGQLVETVKANLCLRSQARREIVIGVGTNSVQPLIAVIGIEIRGGGTNVQLLVAALAGRYDLGATYRREK